MVVAAGNPRPETMFKINIELLTLFGLPEGAPLQLMEVGHDIELVFQQQHEEGIYIV